MQLVRHFAAALVVLLAFVLITILGFASGGSGWIILSFLCLWPLLWAVMAWAIRGFRESYQVVPKAKRTAQQRNNPVGQPLS